MAGAGNLMKVRRKNGSGDIFMGTALSLVSLLWLFGPQGTAALPLALSEYLTALLFAFFFYSGVRRLWRGYGNRRLYGRLLRLQGLFATGGRVPMAGAARELSCDLSTLAGDVGEMTRRGMVTGLHIDLGRAELVNGDTRPPLVSVRGGTALAKASPNITLREERRRSALPLYALGGAWCVYAAFLPMLNGADFLLAGILSLLAYYTTSWKAPDRVLIREEITLPEPPDPTGNTALDELLAGVAPLMDDLRRLDRDISGKLDGPVQQILFTTEQIITQLRSNPASAGEMRQFFSYTLPTTISLLKNYDELSRQPSKGKNITDAMRKIENTIGSIVSAFHRQFDALFRDKALNIAVELEVMEGMLADTASPFEKK